MMYAASRELCRCPPLSALYHAVLCMIRWVSREIWWRLVSRPRAASEGDLFQLPRHHGDLRPLGGLGYEIEVLEALVVASGAGAGGAW